MPAVNLELPSAAPGAIFRGGAVGTTGTSFYIKVQTAIFDFFSPDEDTTGDGDSAPVFENNGYLYGTHVARGAMISSQALGIGNLISTAANPVVDMTFDLGGTRRLTQTILIRRFRVNWRRTSSFVGVAMMYRDTDSHPTEGAI